MKFEIHAPVSSASGPAIAWLKPRKPALELVADVTAMHGFTTDHETDHISRVDKLGAARPEHLQIEARIE